MIIETLFERLSGDSDAVFLIDSSDSPVKRGQIVEEARKAKRHLTDQGIGPGDVVAIAGDYKLNTMAYLLALIELRTIIAPLSAHSPESWSRAVDLVQAQVQIDTLAADVDLERMPSSKSTHALYQQLRQREHSGLVLLSSGTTGQPKAVVHDFEGFLTRFAQPPRPVRTLAFMQFDHVGGIYNLFSCLFNLSTLVYSTERSPTRVGELIAKHKIEFLPTSASFLNILVIDRPWDRFDFHSLKYVVYGTERVNALVLEKITKELPWVKFHQNYGLSEVGLLRSTSKSNDSIWLKIQDDLASVRVRDGMLEIQSSLTMLGYLNAEHRTSPDGWYITGDLAEEKDGWIRVFGRKSDLIKVAGNAVHPSEIEDVIMQMPEIIDVIVGKEENLLLGESITATVQTRGETPPAEMRQKVRQFCLERLSPYKVPSKILVTTEAIYGPRFKKKRSAN